MLQLVPFGVQHFHKGAWHTVFGLPALVYGLHGPFVVVGPEQQPRDRFIGYLIVQPGTDTMIALQGISVCYGRYVYRYSIHIYKTTVEFK